MSETNSDKGAGREWGSGRVAFWVIMAVLALFWQTSNWLAAMKPSGDFRDFLQEWLSARNWKANLPAYLPQRQAIELHTNLRLDPDAFALEYNGHPPAAILLALPFAGFDYFEAHFYWNIASLLLFACGCTLLAMGLPLPWRSEMLFPFLALAIVCYPLSRHFFEGQLTIVLFALVTGAWWLDRRGRCGWAGALIGVAAAVKLSPVALLAVWITPGRRAGLLGAAASFVVINAIAAAILGVGAFETYVTDVLPTLSTYEGSRGNFSLAAFWARLFNPPEAVAVPLVRSPLLAEALTWACRLALAAATFWRCWYARTPEQRDWAMALAILAALLSSPITWNHSLILLPLPIVLLLFVSAPAWERWLVRASLLVLLVPPYWLVIPAMGLKGLLALKGQGNFPVMTPLQSLATFSLPTYAMLIMFVLCGRHFPKSNPADSPVLPPATG